MSGERSIFRGLIDGTQKAGWALVLLGLVAALAPVVMGATVMIAIGLVLLLAGALIALWAIRARDAGQGSAGFVVAALAILAGLVLIVQPTAGLSLVRVLVVSYLVLSGVAEIAGAFELRAKDGEWIPMAGSGLVSVIAGGALWADWPIAGAQAIGIFVGVKLASMGGAVVRLSRRLDAVGDRVQAVRARLR